jgi:hypothetical protein
LAALVFPYAEAIVLTPFLEKKLAALETDRGRLAMIDQELDFTEFLKQSQTPYLEAIYLLAKSAPQGMSLESLSMGGKQPISLRLKLASAQAVTDFRAKLVDSGWFTNVVVEEQAPTPDRRVSVRMTADLRPAESRKRLPVEPPGKKRDRPPPGGGMPDFNMPPPLMMMPQPPSEGAPIQVAPAPAPGGPDTPAPPRARRRAPRPAPTQPDS